MVKKKHYRKCCISLPLCRNTIDALCKHMDTVSLISHNVMKRILTSRKDQG